MVSEFSFCNSDTSSEGEQAMNNRSRKDGDLLSSWNDRHPRVMLAVALLFFLAGLALCARIV